MIESQELAPSPALLEVSHLSVRLHTAQGSVLVVDDVSWRVNAGETIALVGESGCGKTISALSLIRLLPAGVSGETSGVALLEGTDLLSLSEAEIRRVRGRQIGMVFQDPLTAFNPVRRIGSQIGEVTRLHLGLSKQQARERVYDLLGEVGISDPRRRYELYPHELSGGMRQRALLAMAIACEPRVLIADEPTTALDVTMQAQVLDLLQRVQAERQMGLVLITHDVGVVAGMADSVAVIYAGRAVEHGPARAVLKSPDHPYTQGLLASVPAADVPQGTRFATLPGMPPDMAHLPAGCAFFDRCASSLDQCGTTPQQLVALPGDRLHQSACGVPSSARPNHMELTR
jgi:oligopeptide/dipeptide ABC transporter ATP-binding protein